MNNIHLPVYTMYCNHYGINLIMNNIQLPVCTMYCNPSITTYECMFGDKETTYGHLYKMDQ